MPLWSEERGIVVDVHRFSQHVSFVLLMIKSIYLNRDEVVANGPWFKTIILILDWNGELLLIEGSLVLRLAYSLLTDGLVPLKLGGAVLCFHYCLN